MEEIKVVDRSENIKDSNLQYLLPEVIPNIIKNIRVVGNQVPVVCTVGRLVVSELLLAKEVHLYLWFLINSAEYGNKIESCNEIGIAICY